MNSLVQNAVLPFPTVSPCGMIDIGMTNVTHFMNFSFTICTCNGCLNIHIISQAACACGYARSYNPICTDWSIIPYLLSAAWQLATFMIIFLV